MKRWDEFRVVDADLGSEQDVYICTISTVTRSNDISLSLEETSSRSACRCCCWRKRLDLLGVAVECVVMSSIRQMGTYFPVKPIGTGHLSTSQRSAILHDGKPRTQAQRRAASSFPPPAFAICASAAWWLRMIGFGVNVKGAT